MSETMTAMKWFITYKPGRVLAYVTGFATKAAAERKIATMGMAEKLHAVESSGEIKEEPRVRHLTIGD